MADKTKKPTGLKLTRKNDTFTASWKIADKDYGDGQAMQVRKGSGKWSPVSIGKKDKAKGFTVSRGDYYPNTKTVKGKTTNKPKLGSVSFRVRGNRKEYTTRKKVNGRTKDVQINPDVSDWSTKTFTVRKPNNPSISVSTGTWPTSTFSWSVKDSASDGKVYTRMKIDSVLLCDSNISKGKDVDWTKNINGMTIRVNGVSQTRTKYNGTSASASGTLTIQEDSGALQNGHSYTRWVRVIAQGPAGDSAPKYQKHVYADPNKAKIDSVALTPKANGFRAQVKFSSPFGNSRPIKNVDVQWAMDTPAADLACPSGATWTTGKTVIVSDASGGAAFDIDQTIPENECLWFRVNTNWDDATTYGDPFYKAAGALTAPTITDITPNATNHTVTVTATNNASAIPDSFMVVRYYDEEEPDGFDIAIIPHGSTTATGVQCPAWETTPKFGVYAAVGDYSIIERDDGVDQYDVDAQMISPIQTQGGSVPEAPENVSLSATAIPGTIRVQWDWPWDEADSAELSWADHEDAWESTEGPETYTITKLHAAAWNISGLETGQTWYVRVRLIANNGDAVTYGAYSDTKTIDLSSAPLAPVITLTDHVIAEDGEVTASWSYSTTDGTAQAFAEVALVTYENGEPIYEPIAQTQTAQYITMDKETFNWQTGETYLFAVRVISASGRSSDAWSDPEPLTIAEPPTCEITETSLVTVTVTTTDEEGAEITDTVTALQDMPLTITVTGAQETQETQVAIERAAAYHVDRPDETDFNGFEGETVALATQVGDETFSFEVEDLIGRLDDGALYRIIATVQDGFGQAATDTVDFTVIWTEQATEPTAEVEMHGTAAYLTPIANEEGNPDDVCDIYRLSVDRPQLIYEGATFGETYVDPYPTIGEFGGHRFVTRTANGDYIMDDPETGDSLAWYDTGENEDDNLAVRYNIIDFDRGQAFLTYNADISGSWRKDFKETQYLGGSVQGDWNKAVSRTAQVNVTAVADNEQDLIQTMRRLADHTGLCHVRTKDGSSYPADVEVSESYNYATGVKTYEYQLTITRVDPEELDGMTLAEWNEIHDTGENAQ